MKFHFSVYVHVHFQNILKPKYMYAGQEDSCYRRRQETPTFQRKNTQKKSHNDYGNIAQFWQEHESKFN